MIKKLNILILVLLISFAGKLYSQEFKCSVSVQTPGIQGIDRTITESLKKAVTDFINNRKWSNYNFQVEERFECSLVFTFSSISGNNFTGKLNVVLKRPVYNSEYKSTTLNLVDNDIHFTYTPTQRMDFDENSYTNNLTSILAYYAYVMLGINFDTFSSNGGINMFQKANTILNAAQSSGEKGWSSFDGERNRYHLIENILNQTYSDLRTFYYNYHRLGLDVMWTDPTKGRAEITKSLELLKTTFNKRPGLYFLQVIVETKRDELVNIYREGDPYEKKTFVDILKNIDPSNSSKYDEVMK
jgi:hypothetical protein